MSMGTLSHVAEVTGGQLEGTDHDFDSVSTDTRTIGSGQLFFALRGERFDAGDFVAQAATRGAVGAVVEQLVAADLSQVKVPDSRHALGELARSWRQSFSIPVIGITGSNGKTTIKELTAAIMRAAYGHDDESILATKGNLNNEIGVPLTLLSLREQHRAAVVEMGANRPGDIALLANIAAVNIAVISNAARAHLEGFGSIDEVARTKGALVAGLSSGDTAVLNRDDSYFAEWCARAGDAEIKSFGLVADADFRAENICQVMQSDGPVFEFDLITPSGVVPIVLPLVGRHNVLNALAASAAAMSAGASLEDVRQGLATSRNVPGRLRAFRSATGAVIFDDAYNANPDSVAAAIDFISDLEGEPVLVLGDMGELGEDELALHRGIGKMAADAGIERLYCVGELSRVIADGFGTDAKWFASIDEVAEALAGELLTGRNVLIKGSRFMGLDQLVKRIEFGPLEAEV